MRKWVVEFQVSDNWVQEGFDIDHDRAFNMLANELPWAYEEELEVRVIKKE